MSVEGKISWNPRLEEYFATTAEKAHCLSWIHKRSEEIYAYRRSFIDLPVIVISGFTGFFSVGSESMFGNNPVSGILLGVASLFVSILNTVGSYYSFSKRAEGHRIASIQYSRLYRFLMIEMALPRVERMSPSDLLKYTKDNYDRLQEIAPLIPPLVITEFKNKFANNEKYKDVAFPEEANGLEHVVVNTEPSTPGFSYKNPLHNQNALLHSEVQIRLPSSERHRNSPKQETPDEAPSRTTNESSLRRGGEEDRRTEGEGEPTHRRGSDGLQSD